jgi:hypothetical protein
MRCGDAFHPGVMLATNSGGPGADQSAWLPGMLMFLRGFATPTTAYDALLAPLRATGIDVVTPRWYGFDGYIGRYTAADEARDTWALIRQLDRPTMVAGHSRGGQVAWRVAQLAADHERSSGGATNGAKAGDEAQAPPPLLSAIVLIDPVDGSGPRAHTAMATSSPARFDYPTLIIGAGIGGRCAPAEGNHEVFAATTPQAEHLVIKDLGHADLLNGRARGLGRRLCGGGPDPDAARERISDLLTSFYLAHAQPGGG